MYTSWKYVNIPYEGTSDNNIFLNKRLYKGTIKPDLYKGTIKPDLYQGTSKPDLYKGTSKTDLYKGTSKPEAVISQEFNNMPGKTNPYRYYHLPRDYYHPWGKHKNTTIPNQVALPVPQRADSRTFRTQRTMQRPQEQSQSDAAQDNNNTNNYNQRQSNSNKQYWRDKQETQLKRQGPVTVRMKEQNESHFAKSTPRQVQDPKYRLRGHKRVESTSPSQGRGPSHERPLSDYDKDLIQVTSPETTVYDPLYKLRAEQTLPPMIPVSVHDYVGSFPVTKISREKVNRNPLIPVKIPPEYLNSTGRYSPESTEFFVSENYDYESLAWKYSGVPSYKAVGSILSDGDLDDY